jgi:putative glutamine amidotransferase
VRPLIALSTTLGPGGSRKLPQVQINASYLAAVQDAGGAPVLLSPAHDEPGVRALLDVCHGLVLTGGEDVDPARYGQPPHPESGAPNHPRDRVEFLAVEHALERGLPTLAICRGMQLLNVALGGTLVQDLPSQRPGPVIHEQEAPLGHRWHAARVLPGSGLHEVFGSEELFINSFHHQGIDRLAPALRATVWAEDELVEGVESTEHPWARGVQWHPERGEAEALQDRRDPDRRLFHAFVEAANRFGLEAGLRSQVLG